MRGTGIRTLVDTGILYAVFDSGDPYYREVQDKAHYLDKFNVVLPWPVLYETLGTKLARNLLALRRFEAYLSKPHVVLLEDYEYRHQALELAFETSLRRSRPLSLVDCVLRLILDDQDINVNCMFTLNRKDFVDVCTRRRIEMI